MTNQNHKIEVTSFLHSAFTEKINNKNLKRIPLRQGIRQFELANILHKATFKQ